MDILQTIEWIYVASGFGVGFLVGLTGVGGGSLMTPLLIMVFGVNPAMAVGTDLIYASLTKSGGGLVHAFNKTIDWGIVRRLAMGSLPSALAVLICFKVLGVENDGTSALITKVIGGALLLTSLSLFFRRTLQKLYGARGGAISPGLAGGLTILTGMVIGVLVTLSSVGAGAVGMTALVLLYPQMPVARLVGSDIAHAVPLTLVAGLGHWAVGSVDFSLLGTLLLGSLPGILLGSALAPRAPEAALRYVLGVVLFGVAIKFLT